MNNGWTKISNADIMDGRVARIAALGGSAVAVWLALKKHLGSNDSCWPSLATLASALLTDAERAAATDHRAAAIDRKRSTVARALKKLQAAGEIVRKRDGKGPFATTHYRLADAVTGASNDAGTGASNKTNLMRAQLPEDACAGANADACAGANGHIDKNKWKTPSSTTTAAVDDVDAQNKKRREQIIQELEAAGINDTRSLPLATLADTPGLTHQAVRILAIRSVKSKRLNPRAEIIELITRGKFPTGTISPIEAARWNGMLIAIGPHPVTSSLGYVDGSGGGLSIGDRRCVAPKDLLVDRLVFAPPGTANSALPPVPFHREDN